MGISVQLKAVLTSDMMHNRNCHAYLLQLKPFINQEIISLKQNYLTPLEKTLTEQYNECFAYGNLYSHVISALEDQIDSLYLKLNKEQTKALDNLILAIYHNNNQILERTDWINEIGIQTRPTQIDTSKLIEYELKDKNTRINEVCPTGIGSIPNALGALFSSTFKPQLDTNLPSLKNYSYRKNTDPTEYRFSTQAQRHNGQVRISPLFKYWLVIKAQNAPSTQSVSHIYFNNLGLDRSGFDIPGSKERDLSLALHELETDCSLKIAVITFPANKSLMEANHYKTTSDHLSYASVFTELLEIAEGKEHISKISDFRISDKTRNQLFGNKENQLKILTRLLSNSFEAQGINPPNTLSTAQKQAVWLHFTKFELTDHIITTLNPSGYNFSCKDAIDRGAVSSSYYNLIKSFKSEHPIQKNEFERALDAAAANVKGRGMNFHRNIIWNALDNYINANYEDLIKDEQKSWLIFWRDMNCPHSRAHQLLETRITQAQKQLDALPLDQSTLQEAGNKLILAIKEQSTELVSGQRLLLELVSRTSQLLTTKSTSEQSIQSYKNLAKELKVNYPLLNIIGGFAQIFIGILLYLPSLGYSQGLINSGLATSKAGFFAAERTKLSEDILDFSNNHMVGNCT